MDKKAQAGDSSGDYQIADFDSVIRRGYRFGKKIGKGSYGYVVKASFLDESTGEEEKLACKFVDKKKAQKDFLEKFFPREIEVLTKVRHQNIVSIHSIIQSGSVVYIFMGLAENGDLLDYVKKNRRVSEQRSRLWFHQMVSAIKYLHSLDYAHRDLKCENILLSKRFNVKIADFGFARRCVDGNSKKILSKTYCGSAGTLDLRFFGVFCKFFSSTAYASPEVIDGVAYDPMKSDVWALGVVLFVMINGKMPFDDSYTGRLIRQQKSRGYSYHEGLYKTLSIDCITMMETLLEPDPKKRPDITKVNEMTWLKKFAEKIAK